MSPHRLDALPHPPRFTGCHVAELREACEPTSREGGGPVPSKVFRVHELGDRSRAFDGEAELLQPGDKAQSDVRLATMCTPTAHHGGYERLEYRIGGHELPRLIGEVLVYRYRRAGHEGGGDSREHTLRIGEKC